MAALLLCLVLSAGQTLAAAGNGAEEPTALQASLAAAQGLYDASGTLDWAGAVRSNAFRPLGDAPLHKGLVAGANWIRLPLHNTGDAHQRIFLTIANARLQDARLYLVAGDELIGEQQIGTDFPFRARAIHHRQPVFEIGLAPGQQLSAYLRTQTQTAHFLKLYLDDAASLTRRHLNEYAALGCFYGFCLLLLLVYFAGLVAQPQPAVFWLVSFLGVSILYMLAMDGLAFQYLWPDSIWWAHRAPNLLGYLSVTALISVVREFLDTRSRFPIGDRVLAGIGYPMLVIGLASPWLPYQPTTQLLILVTMFYQLVPLVISIRAWREKVQLAAYFTVIFAFGAIVTLLFMLRLLGILPPSEVSNHALRLAFSFDFLVLSAALVNWIRQAQQLRQRMATVQQELDDAVVVQSGMLPSTSSSELSLCPAHEERVRVESVFRPSGALSGDFFHIVQIDEHRFAVAIFDAMGHGVAAALVTSLLRAGLDSLAGSLHLPGTVLEALNRRLHDSVGEASTIYATGQYLVFDLEHDTVELANAGHAFPLLCGRGAVDLSQANGAALGLFRERSYPSRQLDISQGVRLLCLTDGAFEISNRAGQQLGKDRLQALLDQSAALGPRAAVDQMMEQTLRHGSGREVDDDICLVMIEIRPAKVAQPGAAV